MTPALGIEHDIQLRNESLSSLTTSPTAARMTVATLVEMQ